MSPWKLQSSLAVEIQKFINLRRLSGTDYQSQVPLCATMSETLPT